VATAARQLLSRIVNRGLKAYKKVLDWGINEADMHTAEEKLHYLFIKGFYNDAATRGSIPGKNLIKPHFPTWTFVDDKHVTTEALCAMARRDTVMLSTQKMVTKLLDTVEVDHLEALRLAHQEIKEILSLGQQSKDLRYGSGLQDLVQKYHEASQGLNQSKVKLPWESLQEVTGGLQRDDYALIYGRPKTGKSYHLAKLVAHFHHELGLRVLLYTKEMPPEQFLRRTVACEHRLPYVELRSGKLAPGHYEALELALAETYEVTYQDSLIILNGQDMKRGTDTVDWLEGKIEQYAPDVVLVDGLYLMSPASGKMGGARWERITSISQDARQMQLRTGIPLVATVQANRTGSEAGADGAEIAGADALAQDASLMLKVVKAKNGVGALVCAGSRELQYHGLLVNFQPCTDFTEIRPLTEEEAEQMTSKAKKGKKSFLEEVTTLSRPPKSLANDSNLHKFPSGEKMSEEEVERLQKMVANMTL
jgi:predicted ATP-dependent serine protease